MAAVFERGGVWYARFQHRGKDFFRSTGVEVGAGKKAVEASREQAEGELTRMLAEVKGGEPVEALFARLCEAIERLPRTEQEPRRITLAERLRSVVTASLPLADVWQAWLDSPRKRTPSPATVEMYRAYWGRDEAKLRGNRKVKNGLKNWLAKAHSDVAALHEVTPAIAEEYAGHLWRSGVAPRTYNGAVKFLRAMFKTLKARAGLTCDPWAEITMQEVETQGRRNLTTKELRAVCHKADGDLRYWIAIGLYTGLRLGDVVTLRWQAIDFAQHRIALTPSKTRRKGKVVSFPLHPVLEGLLIELRQRAAAGAEYLFPEAAALHNAGKSWAITKRIQEHFEACGIATTETAEGQHRRNAVVRVGFHSLRHSFVSLCAANQVPQVAIQDLVGHGSPAMTRLYELADEGQKRKAITRLPSMKFAVRAEPESTTAAG